MTLISEKLTRDKTHKLFLINLYKSIIFEKFRFSKILNNTSVIKLCNILPFIKIELEQIVSNFRSTLSRKNIH